MIGLLIKDMLNLKSQMRFIVLLIGVYTVFAITSETSAMLGGIIAIMAVMMPITALGYDEKAKWDKYALTMPISRNDLIISKYLLGMVLSCFGFVLNFVFSLFIGFSSYKESFILSMLLLSAGFFFLSLVMPPMFKYGVEKGRIVMMVLIFSPTVVVLFLSKLNVKPPSAALIENYWYVVPLLSVFALVISIGLSLNIYRKKEF